MKITDRFDNEIELTADEGALLDAVQKLFRSKDKYGTGADFRAAFLSAAIDGYCDVCGSALRDGYCYCMRDE